MIAFRDASTSSVRPARSGVKRTKPVEMSMSAFWGASFTASAALASTASRSPSPHAGGASTKTGSLGPSTRVAQPGEDVARVGRMGDADRCGDVDPEAEVPGRGGDLEAVGLEHHRPAQGLLHLGPDPDHRRLEVEPADGHVLDDRARRQPGGGVAVDRDDDDAAQAGDDQPDGQADERASAIPR